MRCASLATKVRSPHPISSSSSNSWIDQVDLLFSELMLFVRMTDLEHRFLVRDTLPTVEEYMNYRMGSGAVGVCLALTE